MMSFNLDAARICKYGEEFPLHLDYVEAMFLKVDIAYRPGPRSGEGPKVLPLSEILSSWRKFGGRLEFSIISLP
jgi:hypothetical protein